MSMEYNTSMKRNCIIRQGNGLNLISQYYSLLAKNGFGNMLDYWVTIHMMPIG